MATSSPPEVFLQAPGLPVANASNPANFGMEANLRRIFRRCVECPNEVPSCPPCKTGEFCTQVFGGCSSCTENKCMTSAQAGGTVTSTQNSGSSGPNVGAIVGGVLGGVAFISIVTFLIWHFCIKNRKEDDAYPEEKDEYGVRSITDYSSSHSQAEDHAARQAEDHAARRASVRSVASSVMTRASNVIQIAFIPGITDRAGEDAPPVPQIPKHQIEQAQGNANGSIHSPKSLAGGSNAGTPIAMTPYRDRSPAPTDAHSIADSQDFFITPQDLQHSRYSQFSDETDTLADGRSTRYRSMASLAPSLARSSIASTHEPMPPMPAQKVIRGRAAVVSVKGSAGSAQNTPATSDAPPDSAGSGDFFKYGDVKKAQSESSGASTITKGEASDAITDMSGPTANPRTNQVAAAIEEATRRASARPTHGGLGSLNTRNGRDGSPRGLRPRPEGAGSPMSSRMRDASPMSANTREQSPMGTRPGTANGRDVSPFSDKHAATPP